MPGERLYEPLTLLYMVLPSLVDLPPRHLCASRGIGDGAWLPTLHALSPIFVRAVLACIVLVLALAKLQPNPMTP